jgi:hypothetical protein
MNAIEQHAFNKHGLRCVVRNLTGIKHIPAEDGWYVINVPGSTFVESPLLLAPAFATEDQVIDALDQAFGE